MHHLILGYGYCGYYLAQLLLEHKQEVTAVSRHLNPEFALPLLNHQAYDLNQPFKWTEPNTTIYYLIPPPSDGSRDLFLKEFLGQCEIRAKKIIYFGSSGVYGNHKGAWVDEDSVCLVENQRQLRRLDAEQQWKDFGEANSFDCISLRVAGIYGPHRLPIEAARAKTPFINVNEAPYTNHIYVRDLVSIAWLLSKSVTPFSTYNISDGDPQPMGTLQGLVARALNLDQAPYETWHQAFEKASPMRREFMQGSKRLGIERLRSTLGSSLSLTGLNDGVVKSLEEMKLLG